MSEQYIVKPIAKALQLLEYVVEEGRELSLTEIAYRTGLPKTTAFRYLQTFCQAGFLSYDPRSDRYRTGVRLWALAQSKGNNAPITPKEKLTITKLETFLVKPRWMFLKIHTNVGIIGLGEPITEGRALTCQTAVKEIEPYLIGKDPRMVTHHWQAIYRHAFYRGGPILTSALSGIDQAL